MEIWITSDWHFNHSKPFLYKTRGFDSIEEMNETIITKYNSLVKPKDEVYILGDLCLGGANKLEENRELLSRLNGYFHIIRGNHDTDKKIQMYKELISKTLSITNSFYLKYNKQHFYLSHYPSLTGTYDKEKPLKQKLLNICGHSHTNNKWIDDDKGLIYHAEIDAHNYYPINIETILADFKEHYA